ncbi:hypothetical protein NEFER03_1160 [Nematocida sp. LUAm3]|nr:hypothetical protein NEFER03_1160 [Nematocida sp. LUAm3]KAI5175769.1 hypothetical protein NEFER02_1638 [Nematocida sp. LUAm2]KAI5178265.1 hypothetical protein NEFER01_1432 [Nematocida sp. LUAm1]
MTKWQERRYAHKQKEQEMQDRAREEKKKQAFKEMGIEEEVAVIPKKLKKKSSSLENIHLENLKKREEEREEKRKGEERRQQKIKQRKNWKIKFDKRTRKGQIPLAHRINYLHKKIQDGRNRHTE